MKYDGKTGRIWDEGAGRFFPCSINRTSDSGMYCVNVHEVGRPIYVWFMDEIELDKNFIPDTASVAACTCGSDKLKHPGHSTYCDKYERRSS